MRALEDFVEHLVLGSVAFLASLFTAYVVSPQAIAVLLSWIKETPASLTAIVPFTFFLGLIFHYISYAINRPTLHRPLLRLLAPRFRGLPDLCNKVRGKASSHWTSYSEDERLTVRVGDSLEWSRFYLFQHGSDELKKQNLRVFYMYRISYGGFFPLLLSIIAGVVGLFLPGRDHQTCAFVLGIAIVLLVGSVIAARSILRALWRYLAYSTEVLVQSQREKKSAAQKKNDRA
jgi:hypothetical protein